jgi:hypothetical protein
LAGQPVSILRRDDSGDWARVISDTRTKGWIEVGALCVIVWRASRAHQSACSTLASWTF